MTEPPTLRIVRGAPTPEELAVITAVVAAAASAAGDESGVATLRRGRWNDPAACHRRPWVPGPGAWRASLR